MSDDVRKHLRTQGKYSDKRLQSDDRGHKVRESKQKVSPATKEPSEKKFRKRNSDGSKSLNKSPTNESISPVKYEENSEYTFEQLEEEVKPIEIVDPGKHVISVTENGESVILYEPQFISEYEGYNYFSCLYKGTDWVSKNIVIRGIEYPQPRLVAWFGPFPYSYSGTTLEPAEMPNTVMIIKQKVEKYLASNDIKASFNSVLLNLYRDGKDSVSWHSDDELTLGISPTIASVSLGETRKFELRPKNFQDSPLREHILYLIHGSLLVMDGCTQDDWQHRVPKEYHDKEPRINLTFRNVYPLEKVPQHVPDKENKKSSTDYSPEKASSFECKLDDVNFPPLNSDASPNVTSSTLEQTKYPSPTLKKGAISDECWDSEISDDEPNAKCVTTQKSMHAISGNTLNENYKKNNFDKKSSKKLLKNGMNSSVCDSQENKFGKKNTAKKLPNDSVNLSMNDTQENNIREERSLMKWSNIDTNSSAVVSQVDGLNKKESSKGWVHFGINSSGVYIHDSKLDEKESPKSWHKHGTNTSANDNQENNINEKRSQMKWSNFEPHSSAVVNPGDGLDMKKSPKLWCNIGVNSSGAFIQDSKLDKKESPKNWQNSGANSSANGNQKNIFLNKDAPKDYTCGVSSTINHFSQENNVTECPIKSHNVEVNSYVNVTPKNNLDKGEIPKTYHHTAGNSSINSFQGNNLDRKESPKMGLNVDAKEFVPINNVQSSKVSPWSEFELENLIHYNISLMQGETLQDFAYNLKNKILARLHEFTLFDREELEFLCKLTDGTQTDKNQNLISVRMCNTVINTLERSSLASSNARRSFDGNSRQRGFGNQGYNSDRGKRFTNQSKNHRYN